MKLDLSNVVFSNNDLSRNIRIPKEMTPDLAYLLGVQLGDGYLKKLCRGTTVDYRICYDGHSINDKSYFESVLRNVIKSLFNKDVNVFTTTTGTVQISFRSKAMFTFLNQVCGVSESPKIKIKISSLIFNSSLAIKKAFIRGLADTDFSLTFKKRVRTADYPVIYYQTSCQSLYYDTRKILDELGFTVTGNYRKSMRYGHLHDAYYLQISGRKQLKKWMTEIGSFSHNHLSRYNTWKKLGKLPRLKNWQ